MGLIAFDSKLAVLESQKLPKTEFLKKKINL